VEVAGLLSIPSDKFSEITVSFSGILTVIGFNFIVPEEGVMHFESLDTGASLHFFGQPKMYKYYIAYF